MAIDSDPRSLVGKTTQTVGNTTIHFDKKNDMCSWISQDFVDVISDKNSGLTFANCLEWCSGSGFIGLRLLESGVCNHVTFLESSDDCVSDIQETLNDPSNAHLASKVSIITGTSVTDLSNSKFDLIVGNPPFSGTTDYPFYQLLCNKLLSIFEASGIQNPTMEMVEASWPKNNIIDENWNTHKDFFSNIKNNLNSNGVIYLVEHSHSSNSNTFVSFVSDGGLQITDTLTYKTLIQNPNYDALVNYLGEELPYSKDNSGFYYLEIKSA